MSTEMTFLLAALACWRLTHFVVAEDGPWDVIVRIRARLGESVFGRAMDCFYCTSAWVAAPIAIALGRGLADATLVWLALSGAASLLERVTAGDETESRPPREDSAST